MSAAEGGHMSSTPRPWQRGVAGCCNIVHFAGDDITGVATVRNLANAELVVHCVNTYDALVETLEAALAHTNELEDAWLRGRFTEHDYKGGTRASRNVEVNRAIRRALALAASAKGEAKP